ncbi:Uncharacterized protein TCM_022392 [Theobroma cacao]|uniref:Uncharacterized protein n=1 Tax=Theobroma cacao TaxID=3641 RepID=A0A061ETC7_THECC|nr:Uncharacterized protein TCM_022392 [Theobroma cacao]
MTPTITKDKEKKYYGNWALWVLNEQGPHLVFFCQQEQGQSFISCGKDGQIYGESARFSCYLNKQKGQNRRRLKHKST